MRSDWATEFSLNADRAQAIFLSSPALKKTGVHLAFGDCLANVRGQTTSPIHKKLMMQNNVAGSPRFVLAAGRDEQLKP